MAKPKRRTRQQTAEPKAAVAKAKPRKRQGNVRGVILGLLKDGPMSASALVKAGKFSPAGGALNLRAMVSEGLLSSERNGREVLYGLTAAGSTAASSDAAVAPRRRGRPPGKGKGGGKRGSGQASVSGVSASLRAALEAMESFEAAVIEELDQKRLVLDRLVASVPAAIGKVLQDIRNDLERVGGKGTGKSKRKR